MAEQEIIKHTKEVYKIMHDKEHGFWHKVKEFLLEIVIIVFAVTISIWLHNWSEHRQEQAQVKDFLTDLKDDLQKDIETIKVLQLQLRSDMNSYNFLQSVTPAYIDSMNRAKVTIMLNANQVIRESFGANYEGFKSSGKIGFIENKQLKKQILIYYQELLPKLQAEEMVYNTQVNKLLDYITVNNDKTDKEILLSPKFKVMLR